LEIDKSNLLVRYKKSSSPVHPMQGYNMITSRPLSKYTKMY
jgi:hypothetical protein